MTGPASVPPLRPRLVREVWVLLAALAGCATAPPPTASAPAVPAPPSEAAPATPPSEAAPVAPPRPAAPEAAPAATAEAALEQRFADWVARFRDDAQAQGIDDGTLRAAFDDVRYLPRVVELDRAQPEFARSVWDYLDITVSPQRVTRGQARLQEVRAAVDAAAAPYGVAPAILVAFWGIESNFGQNIGNTPAIDALATLGFDGRREAWARRELLAALQILQRGDVERTQMIGSWAGAMGHTQLLPSNVLAYAVDGDGDGRRDIWGNAIDAMASTANFLARAGWHAGEPWGAEVLLPSGFDIGRADGALQQPGAQWAAEGVRAVDGAPLPEFAEGGAIVLPAGARGPAFLVGPNFRTIQRYNNSTSYALAVGLLARRLTDGAGVQASWPRELQMLSRDQVIALQTALNARGFDSGVPDGLIGPATRDALRRYQRSVGLPADGYPTLELLERLQAP